MARAIHQLTPERAKHKSRQIGQHRDGGGLFLSVKPPKAASWIFRYMLNGKAREMALAHIRTYRSLQPVKKPARPAS